jgi:hypothetical protein
MSDRGVLTQRLYFQSFKALCHINQQTFEVTRWPVFCHPSSFPTDNYLLPFLLRRCQRILE